MKKSKWFSLNLVIYLSFLINSCSLIDKPISPSNSSLINNTNDSSMISSYNSNKENKSDKNFENSTNSSSSTNSSNTAVDEPKSSILKQEIFEKYSVKAYGGSDASSYKPGGRNTTPIIEETELVTKLNSLERELQKYPDGFFKEFIDKDMSVSIYLYGAVEGNAFTGLTDYEFGIDIRLSLITSDFLWTFTVHHEIMHLIDVYIEYKEYDTEPEGHYKATSNLNPADFQYGSTDLTYVYDKKNTNQLVDKYFVEEYGQTNVKEDRATMFAEMQRAYGVNYKINSPLREKAIVIDSQISQFFHSAKLTNGNWKKRI